MKALDSMDNKKTKAPKKTGGKKKKSKKGGARMLGGSKVSGAGLADIKRQMKDMKLTGIAKNNAHVLYGGANYSVMGTGWLSNLWDGIKSVGSKVLSVAKPIIKDSGVVGSLLNEVPAIGPIARAYARTHGY